MEDNTAKVIEQLAQKLGTTSEYLWGVLIKQAPINATTVLIQFLSVIIFGIILFKIHKKLMKKVSSGKDSNTGYGEYKEGAIIPMLFASLIFVVLFIVCFIYISDIVDGYLNPEYWALQNILNRI